MSINTTARAHPALVIIDVQWCNAAGQAAQCSAVEILHESRDIKCGTQVWVLLPKLMCQSQWLLACADIVGGSVPGPEDTTP